MTEALKCTATITVNDGKDSQGRNLTYHEKCGLVAAEYTFEGITTTATAILCLRHKKMADAEVNRQRYGKKAGKDGPDPRQTSLLSEDVITFGNPKVPQEKHRDI